jgi:hypothetical protein
VKAVTAVPPSAVQLATEFEVFQQVPRAVIVPPPSLVIVAPKVAPVAVMEAAAVKVVKVGADDELLVVKVP